MKKFVSYIVLAALMISMNLLYIEVASGKSINKLQQEINDMENQQDKLKDEQQDLKKNKDQTNTKMNDNVDEQAKVKQDIQKINEELSTTQTTIQKKENEINVANQKLSGLAEEISILQDEIGELKERLKRREALLKDRLLTIQKNGGSIKYIEVIFGSQSFSDFISRAFAVNTIMDQDKTIMEEHVADQKSLVKKQTAVQESKRMVEEQKKTIENQKGELLALKSKLDKQMNEKEVLIAKLEVEYVELEEYKLSVEEEEQIIASQDAALKKAKQLAMNQKANLEQLAREEAARAKAAKEKAEKDRLESQNKPNKPSTGTSKPSVGNGNGIFIWPTPTSHRITSHFNPNRIHPIFGDVRPHNGLDIGAPSGAPVVAVGSGVVSLAGVLGGFGNTVMITHVINGQTYTTLYAHLSSISVSTGQVVNQGDNIGRVGSTGNSTGPHLHMEVHPGGYNNPADPMKYF